MTGQRDTYDFSKQINHPCVSGGGCCGDPECEAFYQKQYTQQIIINSLTWIPLILIIGIISYSIMFGIQRIRKNKLSNKKVKIYGVILAVMILVAYCIFGYFYL